MKKIEAIVKPERFDAIKETLSEHEIKGMTITQVIGCGNQKGQVKYYRGTEFHVNLLPKVKIEIVVHDNKLAEILKVIEETGKTGNIGDGKIFVFDCEDVVRIRTGETGDTAL